MSLACIDQFWPVLHRYQNRPFIWGDSDCFLYVAGVHQALYGSGAYDCHQGQYRCKRSAVRYFYQKTGQRTLASAIQQVSEKVPPLKLKRGDGVIVNGACGVYLGRYVAFRSEKGLVQKPISIHPIPQEAFFFRLA